MPPNPWFIVGGISSPKTWDRGFYSVGKVTLNGVKSGEFEKHSNYCLGLAELPQSLPTNGTRFAMEFPKKQYPQKITH
jgi:hypothetical protein